MTTNPTDLGPLHTRKPTREEKARIILSAKELNIIQQLSLLVKLGYTQEEAVEIALAFEE